VYSLLLSDVNRSDWKRPIRIGVRRSSFRCRTSCEFYS
jgi:hypothetical protein